MSRREDLDDHRLSSLIPKESLNLFPNDDGLSYEEALLLQANMYQSFQERPRNNNVDTHDYGINDPGHRVGGEGERLRSGEVLSYFAIDEDLARSLQELGDEFDNLLTPEQSRNASGIGATAGSRIEIPSWEQTSSSNSRQDSFDPHQGSSSNLRQHPADPDSMQYEELLELTESVDVKSQGIPASSIAELPTSKYKSGGFFSKSKKKETCVICQMDFNYGEKLITLPCLHRYHSKCISRWLMLKKNCPICKMEVK